MVNPFPEVLFLGSFYVPLILRVTLGLFFLWLGLWCTYRHRVSLAHAFAERPVGPSSLHLLMTRLSVSLVWSIAFVEVVVGLGLLVGFLTQIAALLAIVLSGKLIYFGRRYPYIAPGGTPTYLFAIVIAVSLFISGAGAFAVDIPL